MSIESNTLASCLKIELEEEGDRFHFVPADTVNENYFLKGTICHVPNNMALASYQFMGSEFKYQ